MAARDALEAAKRSAESRLAFGFALQQIGFVVVLMAGLVHQHRERGHGPAPVTS